MVDVRDDYPRFQRAGGEVLAVTMGTPEQAAAFRAKLDAPFPMLADAGREAYRAFGLKRGSVNQVLGPKTWLPLTKATFRAGVGKPVGDVWQMPGTFVVDRQGIIRYAHYPANQSQRPSNEELLKTLESLSG